MASMQEEGFYCIPEAEMSHSKRVIYCGLCIATGVAGIIGSSWQAFQWKPLLESYKERRTPSPNPMVVMSLAVSNILAGLGVLLRATVMLRTQPPELIHNGTSDTMPLYGNIPLIVTGNIIEVLNQYFFGVTFMWTMMYAFDIYLQLRNINGSTLLYQLSCWLIPGLTSLGSIVAKGTFPGYPTTCMSGLHLMIRYLCFYIPILFTMLVVPLIFTLSNRLMTKRMRESGLMNNHNWEVLSALKKKAIAVTLLFILCWFANVVDSIILVVAASRNTSPAGLARFFPIWVIEALANPLQGLLNCFVYGRSMLFWRITRHNGRIVQSENTIGEDTPILYTRNASLLFASE